MTTSGETTNMERDWRVPRYRCALVRDGSAPPYQLARRFGNSRDVADWAGDCIYRDADREQFYVMGLDMKNRIIGVNMAFSGGLTSSMVQPREVFKYALLTNAAAVIFLHNHPSGDTVPSADDRACTQRLVSAGKLLGVRVLDHVIVGEGGAYFSFADAGMLTPEAEN